MSSFRPVALVLALMVVNCSLARAAQVDFETLATGTPFGDSFGYLPGQIAFTQDGIVVTVETFRTGSFTALHLAQVQDGGLNSFATRHMSLDNINLGFDVSNLGFPVNRVTIEYHEFGGADNFSVNGGALIELPALTSLPINVGSGVTAAVDSSSITLNGAISRFVIGGQELAIDNIIAVPEPATLALLLGGGISLLRRTKRSG